MEFEPKPSEFAFHEGWKLLFPSSKSNLFVGIDDNDDATLVYYDSQSKGLMSNMTQYRNMSSESVGGDIDGDGDIDFISPYMR